MANNIISSLQLGSGDVSVFTIPYGECSTAANTAAKTVTVQGDFVLEKGAVVAVKFTNSNSVASPTLNVTPQGGTATGAKSIMRYGTTAVSTSALTSWTAGQIVIFMYDGTYWQRTFNDNNTTYSNVALGHGYATCSTAAATAAKTASLSSYALTTGGIVSVNFTNAVPASATLNINSKGAKAIYHKGAAIQAGVIKAGDTATFIYNGTYYHLISLDKDTNTDTQVTQNKLSGSTIEAKVLLTAPGTTATITGQTYFHEGFGYDGATDTITANSSGVICTNEYSGFTTKLDEHGLQFGYDTINYTSSFRINEYGSPSGESDGVKQDWRNYLDIYVQDTEPDDSAPVGAIWIDTSVSSITYAEGVSF